MSAARLARSLRQSSVTIGVPYSPTCAATSFPKRVPFHENRIAEIDKIGVGGLILVFRIGPVPADVTNNSTRLFVQKVALHFRRTPVASRTAGSASPAGKGARYTRQ